MLGLTASDYALWDWALSHGPHMLALGAGLTLPLLLLALVRMGVAGAMRLLGRLARRRPVSGDVRRWQEPAEVRALSGSPRRTSANPTGVPNARLAAREAPAIATDKLAA
jgi:hypothetical protein